MPAVLPPYTLDALYASLEPLRSRLSVVYGAAYVARAPESSKGAWLSSLNQASNMLTRASIEGEMGQLLAMGEVTVQQWSVGPEQAADLVEFVAQQVGIASYTPMRFWREVVIPTVQQVGEEVVKVGDTLIDWGPIMALGVGALLLVWNFAPRRGALGGWRPSRRRRLKAR